MMCTFLIYWRGGSFLKLGLISNSFLKSIVLLYKPFHFVIIIGSKHKLQLILWWSLIRDSLCKILIVLINFKFIVIDPIINFKFIVIDPTIDLQKVVLFWQEIKLQKLLITTYCDLFIVSMGLILDVYFINVD